MATPALFRRRSFEGCSRRSGRWSAAERGASEPTHLSSRLSDSTDSALSSPLRPANLFGGDRRIQRKGTAPSAMRLSQALLIAFLLLFAIWAWIPVFSWLARRLADRRTHVWAAAAGGTGVTRVLLFSEPGCSGEEITLTGGGDLCDLNFPSGTGVKDNVASVYISSSAHQLKLLLKEEDAESSP